MKYTTYCEGIAQGGEAEWDFAWTRYEATNLGTEENLLLQAMGCSNDVWILNRSGTLLEIFFIGVKKK